MGFTIANYSLLGLQNIQNLYCTIKGGYTVSKIVAPNVSPSALSSGYNISFTVYFQASQNSPVITQYIQTFNIQALPNPAVLYKIIYDYVKGQLDSYYMSNQQTLEFTDD
jgi:hypothetical protein